MEGREEAEIPTRVSSKVLRGLNAQRRELEGLLGEAWSRGPFECGAQMRPNIPTLFGKWLDFEMEAAGRITNLQLASSCNELRRLRPHGADDRFHGVNVQVHPPKKEISEYRRGLRTPRAIVAYRIGRALELQFNKRYLEDDRNKLRKLGATPRMLPRTVTGACCPLDALVVAGCWPDAIACIGMFVGKREEIKWDWEEDFEEIMQREVHGSTLSPEVYPALDDAWIQWITNPSPDQLPARFAAAYLLAKSGDPLDQRTAADILQEWEPRYFR
jgi:hypothetical protein